MPEEIRTTCSNLLPKSRTRTDCWCSQRLDYCAARHVRAPSTDLSTTLSPLGIAANTLNIASRAKAGKPAHLTVYRQSSHIYKCVVTRHPWRLCIVTGLYPGCGVPRGCAVQIQAFMNRHLLTRTLVPSAW